MKIILRYRKAKAVNLPSLTAISPIAQVALLQTEINSGFRFCPRIGRNSAVREKNSSIIALNHWHYWILHIF